MYILYNTDRNPTSVQAQVDQVAQAQDQAHDIERSCSEFCAWTQHVASEVACQ